MLSTSRRDGTALSPVDAAVKLGEDPGGIETLCVWIGANNVLGTVIDLECHPSKEGYDRITEKSGYNIWRPEHFQKEFGVLAGRLRRARARHVLLATIPHVTSLRPHGASGTSCLRAAGTSATTDDLGRPTTRSTRMSTDA